MMSVPWKPHRHLLYAALEIHSLSMQIPKNTENLYALTAG